MDVKSKSKRRWQCPKCKAKANKHGKGSCKSRYPSEENCSGLICECNEEAGKKHGISVKDPCLNANCYHCGWSGELPYGKIKKKVAQRIFTLSEKSKSKSTNGIEYKIEKLIEKLKAKATEFPIHGMIMGLPERPIDETRLSQEKDHILRTVYEDLASMLESVLKEEGE